MNKSQYFDLIKSYKLLANKSLGQNFLINTDIAESIVSRLDLKKDDSVLEIGAGLGSLSYFLCEQESQIELIDVDERMLMFLNENFSEKENVKIKRQNVLKADLKQYTKIVGNLPYYITSGIISKLLIDAVNAEKIVLMIQKEVYPKLLSKTKSPLSLMLNYVSSISECKEINRNNFTPVPHVDSVVFELIPNKNIKNKDNEKLFKLIQQMFLLRRKNILNNLTSVVHDKEKAKQILQSMNIDTNKRPEEMDINFYIELLKHI